MKNMNNKLKIFFSLSVIFSLFYSLNFDVNASQIDDLPSPPEDGPSVQGNFSLNGDNFKNPIESKYDNVQTILNGTGGKLSTMWWKNKVNLYKPFTVKFYAYISPNSFDSIKKGEVPGDGITFTLQNDNSKAIGTRGNSLGIHPPLDSVGIGGTVNGDNFGATNNYVKNAFSYEFDSYYNGDNADNSLSDINGNPINAQTPPGDLGQHTAFTTTSTIQDGLSSQSDSNNGNNNGDPSISNDAYFKVSPPNSISYVGGMNHYQALPLTVWNFHNNNDINSNLNFLARFSSEWHKVIYTWTPHNDGTGTANVNVDNSSVNQTQTINTQNILGASKDNPYVWWGFSGSTGSNSMIAAIADTEVTGDPGISKLVLNLSKLSDDQKNTIIDKINNLKSSEASDSTKNELINCISNPSGSSSNPELSNRLVKLIPSDYFKPTIGNGNSDNADIGDVLLYKVDIYNYINKNDDAGNTWQNVKVHDKDLEHIGMRSLDNQNNIDADYGDIPPSVIDTPNKNQPSSAGLRTIITDDNQNKDSSKPRSNSVTATGNNFVQPNTANPDVNRSSRADVYVNSNSSKPIPRVIVDNKISNITRNDSIDNTLSNVHKYDDIKYDVSLKNIVQNSSTSDHSTYSFWIPSLNKINDMDINGNKISNNENDNKPYYQISDGYDKNDENKDKLGDSLNSNLNGSSKKLVTVHNISSIAYNKDVNISANIKIDKHYPNNFSSYPIFHDTNTDNYYIGNKENYNFYTGSLGFNYIRNIDYGLSAGYLNNGLLSPYRIYSSNPPYDSYTYDDKNYSIAQINDTRVNKVPYRISLSQNDDDKGNPKAIGNENSPFILNYLDNGIEHKISPSNDPVNIYNNNTENDDDIDQKPDIVWNRDKELRLGKNNKFNSQPSNGEYKANLNWTINNAP